MPMASSSPKMQGTSSIKTIEVGASLHGRLADLYHRQLAIDSHDQYLIEHGSHRFIANQVLTFLWYRSYLPEEGVVLDWGCNHAPDSCLLRMTHGQRLQLHGCDFVTSDRYSVFHEFAGLSYTRLNENISLPYEPDSFDAVIGSGTLEHTAMDYESLKQLYRVLKPEGVLVISYLPYWLSLNEWTQRTLIRQNYHKRLYSIREAKQLLKRSGFLPIFAGYHTYFWENILDRVGIGRWNRWNRPVSRLLSRLLPIHAFCDTLYFIARKVMGFY